ncbi:hypothetical protein Tco_0753626 [Tanacetum coccineum]
MASPRLQELAATQNFNNFTDAMSAYIQRKINDDLQFAAGLTMQCAEFLQQLSQTEVLKMLEIRKIITKVHIQVHKKIDFLTVLSTTAAGLAGGSVATRSITIPEVIDDCMSPQSTHSSEDETEPPATHGTRSPTSKSLTKDDICSSEFTIYEMMIGCSVWTVRYRVDTDDFMTPLPEGWSIRSTVWSIVLGEREQDSFLVINLSGKVIQYNLISKTLHEIYDCVSNQLDDNHDDDDDDEEEEELLQQF